MLREGQRKGICITQGESELLPYAAGTFDRVIVIDAFHHLWDQGIAAQELLRVLAPGGRLVIEEPDIAHCGVKLVALAEKLLMMRSRFFSPQAIRALFADYNTHTHIERDTFSAWVIVERV